MSGPWDKYAKQEAPKDGPWAKYSAVGTVIGEDNIPNWKRNVSNIARPTLEATGGVVGGILGGAAASPTVVGTPGGVAIGGALGVAAGKETADLLDMYLGLKQEAKGPIEKINEDLLYGAKTELVGHGFGMATKAISKPLAKPVGGVIEKAKAYGVKLTPAEIAKSKPWALVESTLEKIPFSSGIINKFRGEQAAVLEKSAQNLISDLGSVEASDVVGRKALKSMESKFYSRLSLRDKLFDKLTESVPLNTRISTNNLKMTAEALLSNEQQLPRTVQLGGMSDLLNEMRIGDQGLSFQGAKNLRDRFSRLIGQYADTPEKQIYKRLKNSLDDDISEFSINAGGEVKKAWERANSYHAAVKELNDRVSSLKSIADKQPEKFVRAVFKPGSITNIKLIQSAMSKNEFANLQKAFVSELFEGRGTPYQNLTSNISKYGDETLSAALPKNTVDRLKDFSSLIKNVKIAEKVGGNPSGTAQNVITFASGAFFITNPVKGTVAVVTPPLLAKMYLSDFGKKLITEGISINPSSARAAGIASAIIAYSKSQQSENKSE